MSLTYKGKNVEVKIDMKKTTKTAAKTTTKAAVEATAKKADETVKVVAKKADEVVKEAAKKADTTVKEATKAVKETAKKADETVKAVKTTAAKAVKKEAEEVVFLQYLGKEIDTKDLSERVKALWAEEHKAADMKSLKLYLKPEENAAYYVVNDDFTGKIEF